VKKVSAAGAARDQWYEETPRGCELAGWGRRRGQKKGHVEPPERSWKMAAKVLALYSGEC